tara:strand:- start:6038 stop:7741 length:1704 start_codon:yes stop_codon:yes gene_type:complete
MKQLRSILFIVGTLLCYQSIAQSNAWILSFGSIAKDGATAITEDQSGNIITAGIIKDSASFTWRGRTYNLYPWRGDCFITKQTAAGQLIWLRHIGGTGSIQVKGVATDAQDNFYITGLFTGTADFNPTSNNFDLISTDPQGDIFVAKYDDWGNFIWAKGVGGSGLDYGSSILIGRDSNVFIAGSFEGGVDFDPGSGIQQIIGNSVQDAFVLKLGLSGNFKSIYPFGGVGPDFCTDLKMDNQGHLLVSGSFGSQVDFNPTSATDTLTSSGLLDAFILKLDSNLSFNWVKKIGGTGTDAILAVNVDDAGKIYLVGAFEGACDFNPGLGVSQLIANNIDGFVLQLNATGQYQWVNKIGGVGDDQVVDVAIDQQYKIYVTGYFRDTVDFDPDTSVSFNLVAQGNYDHYIYQLDTLGAFSSVQQFTGNTVSAANRVFIDQQGNLYTAGYFEGTVDFDPSTLINSRTSIGQSDVFIQRHNLLPLVDLLELFENDDASVKFYPNPTQARIRVAFQEEHKIVEVKIYDKLGRLRQNRNYTNVQIIETVVEGRAGVYYVELVLNFTERKVFKIVKN